MQWLGLLAAARRGRRALQALQLAAAVRVAQRRAHPALQVLPGAEAGPAARVGHAASDVI
jgi:hypothetical protein